MTLSEAHDQYAQLLRKLDPSNDLQHLCKDLRAKGWVIEVTFRRVDVQVVLLPSKDGILCSNCGQLVLGGGCKPCTECGTMSGGCA